MRESIARTTGTFVEPPIVPHSCAVQRIASTRTFKQQTQWKSILDAAAPLTPAEWLEREISRLAGSGAARAGVAETIAEALCIAGDRSNPYAVAAAAEYLSAVRLPDRPQRNAHLSAVPTTAGGGRS